MAHNLLSFYQVDRLSLHVLTKTEPKKRSKCNIRGILFELGCEVAVKRHWGLSDELHSNITMLHSITSKWHRQQARTAPPYFSSHIVCYLQSFHELYYRPQTLNAFLTSVLLYAYFMCGSNGLSDHYSQGLYFKHILNNASYEYVNMLK